MKKPLVKNPNYKSINNSSLFFRKADGDCVYEAVVKQDKIVDVKK